MMLEDIEKNDPARKEAHLGVNSRPSFGISLKTKEICWG